MGSKQTISSLVTGGEASAGPPLGPALGPMGVNIMEVISAINEKTNEFKGMKIPVTVSVDSETKKWEIEVGIPSASALILKEANIQKGSGIAMMIESVTKTEAFWITGILFLWSSSMRGHGFACLDI